MIIEIKDLPHGRKVKHINVDITFEEDGTISTIVKDEVDTTASSEKGASRAQSQETESDVKFESTETPTPNLEDRPKKEIPPEMQDMEF
jgi:hypothetical protein